MNDDPYASHLSVLKLVLGLVKPLWVLELGAGKYSTPCILDCPSVARLDTYETDERWMPQIDDPRLVANLADPLTGLPPLDGYDLIFVDNADNPHDRERAIRMVLGDPRRECPVVIHDADYRPYRQAIAQLADRYWIEDRATPWTAVAW